MRTSLVALAVALACPGAIAATDETSVGLGLEARQSGIGAGSAGVGGGATVSGSREADGGATVSGRTEAAAESDRSVGMRQRGEPKDDVKARPRRDLPTPRSPREVTVPGAGGTLEGSGAIR